MFYEQRSRQPSSALLRRADLDGQVEACFAASGGIYGSPRVHAQLRCDSRNGLGKDRGGVHDLSGPPEAASANPGG